MKTLLFIMLLCITSASFAATFPAVLLSKQTGKPIAYANVGIIEKDFGTVTDELGKFSLNLADTFRLETIRISMIGYESMDLKVEDFKRMSAAGEAIYLVQHDLPLQDVVVKSRVLHHRILGNTANNKHQVFGFEQYKPGYEAGTYMRIKRSPTYIDSIRIKVAKCDYDSVFFRLNIYEEREGELRNILTEPLYISMSTAEALKGISLDLTRRDLIVKHNFVVSVELVKDLGGKEMFFCAETIGAKGYLRVTSQGVWRKFIFGPSFSAYVTY